jgi:hypothetical protein
MEDEVSFPVGVRNHAPVEGIEARPPELTMRDRMRNVQFLPSRTFRRALQQRRGVMIVPEPAISPQLHLALNADATVRLATIMKKTDSCAAGLRGRCWYQPPERIRAQSTTVREGRPMARYCSIVMPSVWVTFSVLPTILLVMLPSGPSTTSLMNTVPLA